MPQFHSTVISEPLAQAGGLVAGLTGYAVTGFVTQDHNAKLFAGCISAGIFNLLIGAPINFALMDVLALVVARPLSAVVSAKLTAVVLGAFFA